MPLCFAYGSNMDRDAMAGRCPASSPIGLARLARHRLAFMREGYLTVAPALRSEVWGLLWDVALADLPSLDRYEGVAAGLYRKIQLPVILEGGGTRRALVYLGANAGPGHARPGYLEAVIAAARGVGLPPKALAALISLQGGVRIPPASATLPTGASPSEASPGPVRARAVSPAGRALGPAERLGRWEP